ncbi:XRE family transcriptional regulator [Methylobacterium currus]|uniref:XRE family transcriptional regulator n=1 Tax=Methylobacterium currus TaxID=2051553 RepID=A0A2R4WI27_9HYPH|nr:helix-turn-helix transcriptional regulator [Methylobacterium currus]AWB21201.1 XRE family transcriptional regulator [Methylobacterium currus]
MSSTVRNRMIGARIRLARKKRGITIRELADVLGVAAITISQYELGEQAVSRPRLEQIAKAVAVPVRDLTARLPLTDMSDDEVEMVQAVRAMPPEGRAYMHRLMVDAAAGRVAR